MIVLLTKVKRNTGKEKIMLYGYARVSTQGQRLERQVRNIEAYAGDRKIKIFHDKYSGASIDRPAYNRLKSIVKKGDTIVFDSVSRMSRNAEDGFGDYLWLLSQEINLVFLKERHIDTDVYRNMQKQQIKIADTGNVMTDNLVKSILAALNEFQEAQLKETIRIAFEQAEKELLDIRQRISEGIRETKLNNEMLPENERKQIGRKGGSKIESKRSRDSKPMIRALSKDFDGGMSDKEIMERLNLSRNSYYKYKKELRAEDAALKPEAV